MRPELRVLKAGNAWKRAKSVRDCRDATRIEGTESGFTHGEEACPPFIAEMRPELRVLKEMAQHLLSIACNHCRDATRIEGTESRSYMKHLRSYMKLQRCDPN